MSKIPTISRRQFCAGVATAVVTATFSPKNSHAFLSSQDDIVGFNPLFIPELIDSRTHNGPIDVSIQNGQHEFVAGRTTPTLGYNGSYLGPTIRMYQGEDTHIRFTNLMKEPTTVHGHGLHVPGEVDGGPQLRIEPGETWDVTLPIVQEASTNWYHPHLMGTTAKQVHAGLAGFYLIEDENSQLLGLPNTYGLDDIPIAIQDRTFKNGVMTPYPTSPPDDLREDTIIVNGTLNPVLEVPPSLIRLRLLNGANARAFEIYRSDGGPLIKIATEGGLLEQAVKLESIKMSPGERNEVIIDMSAMDEVDLKVVFLAKKYTSLNTMIAPTQQMLRLKTSSKLEKQNTTVPYTLNHIQPYNADDALVSRSFDLEDMAINGVKMDPEVINEQVKLGELEIWTIDSGRHPFHMHGASFQILSINGKAPAPEDRGWKDTINPRGQAKILLRFNHEASKQYPYMYHCHILEHEDMGMMGQFTVT
ncbi:multicopper oxidase family protein [Pseudovibrio brasiliensis]|uniref:Multicopper oxidase CueO n=1 Tax=Pseudovibrio brasiliensis TaxID=1898042 RepID=A0ABX8AND4_9HYPH|nr:multicopper oxidase domain-containing protein [Pseudovibrio brasiliensis]QUS56584.1 multicopper oxidase domain-containing protein [Pseudovibrio brasiliensis]